MRAVSRSSAHASLHHPKVFKPLHLREATFSCPTDSPPSAISSTSFTARLELATYTFERNLTCHSLYVFPWFFLRPFTLLNGHIYLVLLTFATAMSSPAPAPGPTTAREAIARAIAERAPTNPHESPDATQYAQERDRRVFFRRLVDPGIARGAQPTQCEATLQVYCNAIRTVSQNRIPKRAAAALETSIKYSTRAGE
jgi:hypothetical protein